MVYVSLNVKLQSKTTSQKDRKMEHIKAVYDMLEKQHPDRLTACVRKGSLTPLLGSLGVPLDSQTSAEVMKYAKEQEAAKLTPPYLLSDYLVYIYDGMASQFGRELGIPGQQVDQYIYDGCYWHDGVILRPVELHDDSLSAFVSDHITFGKGKALRATFWPMYVLWAADKGKAPMSRVEFLRTLSNELASRGYDETRSVRIGEKVAAGYKGISVKNV